MQNKKLPKNSGKAPSIQFYYKDWLEDQKLKRVSKAVKGVWIDVICCSCDMPVQGVFFDEGKPLKKREILQLLTGNSRENYESFTKIIRKEIIKRFEDGEYQGAYYVKRVYRDMELRRIRQECGKLGGNPNLVKQNGNQNPTPSSSSSSSIKKYVANSIELQLATLLFTEIRKRKPDYKNPDLQKWSEHIGLMIRRDNRDPAIIEQVIVWCQADTGDGKGWAGWQNNILSTKKLREKFDKLELDMQEEHQSNQPPTVKFEDDGPSAEFIKRQLDGLLLIPENERTARDREEIGSLKKKHEVALTRT